MLTVYGDHRSGHCYKVKLVCALLDIDFQWVEVDLLKKEHLEEAFLSINPKHQVPTLVIKHEEASQADGQPQTILTESNAIINYLAHNSFLIPNNRLSQSKILQWQFFEQSKFQPPISAIRWIKHFQNMPTERQDEYLEKLQQTKENFNYLNNYLATHKYLVDDNLSLADITLFAYTHIADMGGIDFTQYPNIVAWLNRIKKLPKFVTINA